jgi:release factor glutamine methyltransferase
MKGKNATYFDAVSTAALKLRGIIKNKKASFIEAEAIMLNAASITKEKLYICYRDSVPVSVLRKFCKYIKMRLKNTPIQYITGSEYFYGRLFNVKKGVFIPRPDTEALIDAVISIKDSLPSGAVAADCGSGSGIIPVTLLNELDKISLFYCFDRNPKAVKLTIENALKQDVIQRIKPLKGDFFDLCRRDKLLFDVIASNPPYIRLKDLKSLQKEVLKEPRMALTDEGDGYSFYKKFSTEGPAILKKGGFLAMEIGDDMGKRVRKLFLTDSWRFEGSFRDFRGSERALVFKRV